MRCTYCDTTYAFKGGQKLSISEILKRIEPFQVNHVLLTGGEPLLQRQTPFLAKTLKESGYQVSIETHGEVSIQAVSEFARIIMDVKTPSSKMNRMGFVKNIPFLKSTDEVKFVIASPEDYEWSKTILKKYPFPAQELLFSPVVPNKNSPGSVLGIEPKWLAEQILKDKLPVRMQLQLHKIIWGADKTGV